MLNSNELVQNVISIQKQVQQKNLRLGVKFFGKTNESLQPVKNLYFDDHHNSIVLVIDDPDTLIVL